MAEIIETYQLETAAISVLVAVLASYAALHVSAQMMDSRGMRRKLWLISGSLVMAVGIWVDAYHWNDGCSFRNSCRIPIQAADCIVWRGPGSVL
ncbi:hypothetical protein [Sinobaca sp. H24]|uniref:hypothetical protein n=1 Tax=Sinobaca sp. H24 TaxID=2923376 RepID=UPI00207A8F9B|nr:hypothetical protein [Sinobaca sp. H24]